MKDIEKTMKEKLNIDATSIKFFVSGIINDNYIVNDRYLYRRRKDYSRFNLDALNEAKIEEKLKGTNITIPYLYIDQDVKITEFISSASDLSHLGCVSDEALIAIANKLRELHSYHFKADSDFLPFNRIEEYYFNAHTPKLPMHDEIIERMRKYYKEQNLTLCHNDLVPGNIIYDNGQYYFIDFEYASNNVPFFDIASFLTSNDIEEPERQKLFLDTYYQHNIPSNINEMIEDFCVFLDLMWSYWSIMMFKIKKDSLYLEMAKKRASRLKKYLNVDFFQDELISY